MADGVVTATVANPTVTKTLSVDMPSWAPTDPTMAAAWSSMISVLRAHEARPRGHRQRRGRPRCGRASPGSASRCPAGRLGAFTSAVQSEWNGWLAQHQADQTAIDPYSAVLDCSGGGGEESARSGGGGATGGELAGLDDELELGGL